MNSNIRQVPNVGEFSYFRDNEDGMSEHLFDDATSLKEITPAWMSADHREGDSVLVQWLDTALHGDVFYHRAGAVVCVARRYKAGPPLPIHPKSLRTEDVRRATYDAAMAEAEGNLTHAAKLLGISRRTVSRWRKQWANEQAHGTAGGAKKRN